MNGMEAFLYILLRDHLPAGEVEGIVRTHVELPRLNGSVAGRSPRAGAAPGVFSNDHMAAYAKELAQRLADE
jgi:hypothetical protein